MSIACAALMCHAPIVIPEIGGARAPDCAATTAAMSKAARALVAHEIDVCVLISPHAPRSRARWGIGHADQLSGSFARFGHPAIALSFRGAPEAAALLAEAVEKRGLGCQQAATDALDHGSLVPLYFLREAGYQGRVLLVALPYPNTETELEFGAAIRDAATASGQRWAVLASGDMSHRLTRDAPAGYTPRAREFDDRFVSHVRDGDLRAAIGMPAELLEVVAEDVVQSTAVAAGAIDFDTRGTRLFGYEGPFGVGYCEALLFSAVQRFEAKAAWGEAATTDGRQRVVELAVHAIEARLAGERVSVPKLPPPWDAPRAVFVTLRSPDGELRGCIGRTEPLASSLAAEVIDCATAAATRDHRVAPVSQRELATLQVEVSVLSPVMPVTSRDELDPDCFGVVVRHGTRRGVLLPGIEGIDSVDDQLAIALQKAHIDPDAPYQLERFTVDKIARLQTTH